MSFNGSGTFNRIHDWQADRDASVPITASRMDADSDDFATGLSTCITKDGQTTITANLPMAGFNHTGVGNASARDQYLSAGQFQDGTAIYAVGAGTADVQTVTLTPAITAYTDGMVLYFEAGATNTGAMTLNVNSVGAQSVVLQNGDNPPAGAITSGYFYTVIYDLTNTNWVLINPTILNSLNIISDDTTTNVFDVVADAVTTANALNISADGLTTGSGINVVSDSADTNTRDVVNVHQDNALATGARCLHLVQDSTATALIINTNDDGRSVEIGSAATTSRVVDITASSITSGRALSISCDALTTGFGLVIASNSSSASTRTIAQITNDHADATNTTCLTLNQDASSSALSAALRINNAGDSRSIVVVADDTTTESAVFITVDGLTTGKALEIVSTSSSTSTRELVTIHNDSSSASSTVCLELIQDAAEHALFIDMNGNGRSINITSSNTSQDTAVITSNSLTSGSCLELTSSSSSSTLRGLLNITNSQSAAGNTYIMQMIQNADNAYINFDGTSSGSDTVSAISTLTTSGSVQGHIQISVGGTTRWIPFYSNPS